MLSLEGLARTAAKEQGLYDGDLTTKTAFYHGAFTDFIYIPKRFVAEFTYLAYHFSEHPVHHEMAIPNIVRLLSNRLDDFAEHLPHVMHVGKQVIEAPAAIMLPGGRLLNDSMFVHPVKFTNDNVKEHFTTWWVQASCGH